MHNITCPLPNTHPEFTIIHHPVFTEYRVTCYQMMRDGSGRIVDGPCIWSWMDAGVIALVAFKLIVRTWFKLKAQGEAGRGHVSAILAFATLPHYILVLGIGIVLTWLVWARCTQVLHESLLIFPTLGIQLETHRGHPLLPFSLSVTRHFIPLSALEDVIIHEGFRRWNVRYYLAVLQRCKRPLASTLATAAVSEEDEATARPLMPVSADASDSIVEVHVAFKNILPYFPVLHAVYHDIYETLFPQPSP